MITFLHCYSHHSLILNHCGYTVHVVSLKPRKGDHYSQLLDAYQEKDCRKVGTVLHAG